MMPFPPPFYRTIYQLKAHQLVSSGNFERKNGSPEVMETASTISDHFRLYSRYSGSQWHTAREMSTWMVLHCFRVLDTSDYLIL
jgi:hypothetical protein